jgi:predicted nucleic acid-binding protein
MTIVDSNTWVDFFDGVVSPHVERLDRAFADEEDLAVVPIILTEVLQGFQVDRDFERARDLLTALPVISADVDRYVRAASLFRDLRRRGVTVRGAVDCVIAQTCLDLDAELLSPDRDFEHIARNTALRLWRP